MKTPASDMDQVRSDYTFIAAHGGRGMLLTALVLVMALASIATAPPADLPWSLLAGTYASAAGACAWLSRRSSSGGIVPIGALGDTRFVLAVIGAVGIGVTPADVAHVAQIPFGSLLFAAALCGAADGAWIATAQRHLKIPPVHALALFLRAIRCGEATSWRMMTGGHP